MSWLLHIRLLFNCHIALDQSMQVHLSSAVLCPSLLPYCLLMTTAFPPRSADCKVLSFMILVMTNWKPSSWLCLVYKWRFSVLGLITQMILILSLPLYTMMNKNNWPAASSGVTPEWGVLTGDQFCTFQLICGWGLLLWSGVDDPRSVLWLWAAWQEQRWVLACDEVLISVLMFIFWVFWSFFSCLWTRNKSCEGKKNKVNK